VTIVNKEYKEYKEFEERTGRAKNSARPGLSFFYMTASAPVLSRSVRVKLPKIGGLPLRCSEQIRR
jgi:hypothetical protein